jgi:hypothetical protein
VTCANSIEIGMWSPMVSMVIFQSICDPFSFLHRLSSGLLSIWSTVVRFDQCLNLLMSVSRHFSPRPCEFCSSSSARSLHIQERCREGWDTGHLCWAYADGPRTQEVCSHKCAIIFLLYFDSSNHDGKICYRWNSSNPWSGFSPVAVAWTVTVDEVLNYVRQLLMK